MEAWRRKCLTQIGIKREDFRVREGGKTPWGEKFIYRGFGGSKSTMEQAEVKFGSEELGTCGSPVRWK